MSMSLKIVLNLLGPMRSYIVRENHIGLEVRKFLQYTQTDRHLVTFFYKDTSLKDLYSVNGENRDNFVV